MKETNLPPVCTKRNQSQTAGTLRLPSELCKNGFYEQSASAFLHNLPFIFSPKNQLLTQS